MICGARTSVRAKAALGDLGDARAIEPLKARAAYGQPERVRTAAITSLGKLGKKTPSAVLPTLLLFAQNDPYFRARSTAVAAIGRLGQRSALEPLAKIEATDTEVSVTNAAYDAIAEINDALAKKPGHP